LKEKINSTLIESTQSGKKLEYVGKFDFVFETNLGYELGDKVGAFDEKKQKLTSRSSVPLCITSQ
jgi:hypothetical protein